MQLLFLTTSYPRHLKDEASIFVARLAESFIPMVGSIKVVVPRDSTEPKIDSQSGVEVRRFAYRFGHGPGLAFGAGLLPNLRSRPWQFWQLLTMLMGFIFHSLILKVRDTRIVANWILAGFAAAIVKLLAGTPFIYVVRGAEANFSKTLLGRVIFKIVITQSGKTICVSQSLAEQLKVAFPDQSQKITFISNGVSAIDIQKSAEDPQIQDLQPYLVSVGTVIPRKNLAGAIQLLSTLIDSEVKLVVLGRVRDASYFSQIKNLIARLNLENRVLFLGEIDPNEVPKYIASSQAFVSTSQFEGMPNALLEAMALKKPVIVSDIKAHREVIQDDFNGLVLDQANLSLAAARVSELLSDPDRMTRLGLAAFDSIKDRTWVNCSKNYLEILTQL